MEETDKKKMLRLAERAGEELIDFGKKLKDTSRLEDTLKEFSEEWNKVAQDLSSAGLSHDVSRYLKQWKPTAARGASDDEHHYRRARRIAVLALGALAAIPLAAGVLALQDRIQRLRIKAEMLCLRARLGKMDMQDAWDERQHEFRRRLDQIRSGFSHAKVEALEDLEYFRKEVAAAYHQLEKALTRH